MSVPGRNELEKNAVRAKLPPFCIHALLSLYDRINADPAKKVFLDHSLAACMDHTLKEEEIASVFPDRKEAELFNMLIIVCLIERGFENYRKKGIPCEILEEGLQDIPVWLDYHMQNYGYPGFQWRIVSWCRAAQEGDILQFGRLQLQPKCIHSADYNIYRDPQGKIIFAGESEAEKGWTPLLVKGDIMVGLHIPASGPLLREKCIDSFRRMRKYLAEYRPDIKYKVVNCSSWLLDPQLKEILPASSNILAFQDLGHIRASGKYCEDSTIERVFGEKARAEGIDAVPHKTGMQKRLAEFSHKGGRFDAGSMFIFRDEFDALIDG